MEMTGMRQVAKVNNGRFSQAVAMKLDRLVEMLKGYDGDAWRIGDAVVELMDSDGLELKDIVRHTAYSKPRLSEFHLTARSFPPDQRSSCSFQNSLLARKIRKRFKTLDMGLLEIRAEIMSCGIRTPRQAKVHFLQKLIERQSSQALSDSAKAHGKVGAGLLNRCHHADYRSVVPLLPDRSVKLFLCDPPFGGYCRCADGAYLSGRAETSGLRIDCDSNSDKEALEVTLSLFSVCLPKLAVGGCLVLFQPGAKPDRPEVLEAAQRSGWACRYALTWLKTRKELAAPGNCATPYSTSTERMLVFSRRNESLRWHEKGLSRSDVLVFQAETNNATRRMDHGVIDYNSVHMFSKPVSLCEFLVRKHSHPGELVVEPFGCSGSGVIAAGNLSRKWLYCESNDENFAWGSRRVADAVGDLSLSAG